jgi:uncharacterized protein YndB with AHSA1/START domain
VAGAERARSRSSQELARDGSRFTRQYRFGVSVQSDWKAGSPWQLNFPDGRVADAGEIIEADPPKRLVIRWRNEFKPEMKAEGYSRCTMELEPRDDGAVKLTITHAMEQPSAGKFIEGVSGAWPLILSNLKSLLERGELALQAR